MGIREFQDAPSQYFYEAPPMATGTAPAVVALAATTAPAVVDLTTVPGSGMLANTKIDVHQDGYNPNCTGHMVTLEAVGADIYVAFGPSIASLTGGNAVSATAVSTVNGTTGAVTLVPGGALCIPQGKAARFKIPGNQGHPDNADRGVYSPARFLAFLTGTGSGILQIYQSSP